MFHQLQNINFSAVRLQTGPAGAPLTSEGVRAILRRHHVCYDFWLQGSGPRPGVTTYSGYLHDVNAPTDACQWRCLNDMLAKLDNLGVHEGVLPAVEAAVSQARQSWKRKDKNGTLNN
jgi:hypothetical protein